MNKLAIIISFEIILEKFFFCQKLLWNSGTHYTCKRIIIIKLPKHLVFVKNDKFKDIFSLNDMKEAYRICLPFRRQSMISKNSKTCCYSNCIYYKLQCLFQSLQARQKAFPHVSPVRALPAKIRLGLTWLRVTNNLTYYGTESITAVKSFIV